VPPPDIFTSVGNASFLPSSSQLPVASLEAVLENTSELNNSGWWPDGWWHDGGAWRFTADFSGPAGEFAILPGMSVYLQVSVRNPSFTVNSTSGYGWELAVWDEETTGLQLSSGFEVPASVSSAGSGFARYATVAAKLTFVQVLPSSLAAGAQNTIQVFFAVGVTAYPASGVEVEAPPGFDFGSSCSAEDLGDDYHRGGNVPSFVTLERLRNTKACTVYPELRLASVSMDRPLYQGKTYGFSLNVQNPSSQAAPEEQLQWIVRTRDATGAILEESFGGAAWYQGMPQAEIRNDGWSLYASEMVAPTLRWGDLLPFSTTMITASVTIFPVQVPYHVTCPVRIVAPLPWVWEPAVEQSGYWKDTVTGSTAPWPNGTIPVATGETYLQWDTPLFFSASETYGIRVPLRVPWWPTTGSSFIIEFGYRNGSLDDGHNHFAAVMPGPSALRVIRSAWVDHLTGRMEEEQVVRVQVTTVSPIYRQEGFVFEGGSATRRLECTCPSLEDAECDITSEAATGSLVLQIVATRTLNPGRHSFSFKCTNPPNLYAAGTWKVGAYQDPLSYPELDMVDAATELAGFSIQESMFRFERLEGKWTAGFDPRPLRQGSTILLFSLPGDPGAVAASNSKARLRAPEGMNFSMNCLDQIVTDILQIFPDNETLREQYQGIAAPFTCEGRDNMALLEWQVPMPHNVSLAFRVDAVNPELQATYNLWALEVDDASSRSVAGAIVQTFKDVSLELASQSARMAGSKVGDLYSNIIRLIFSPSTEAESMVVTAPAGFDFGNSSSCDGLKFIGRELADPYPVPFTLELSGCNQLQNRLEVVFALPDFNMTPTAYYTLDVDLLTPELTGSFDRFHLSSTAIGGGIGDEVYIDTPILASSLQIFQVKTVSTENPRSGETAVIDAEFAFPVTAYAASNIRLSLPPGFIFNETVRKCPVDLTSPSSGPVPTCRCFSIGDCAILLNVISNSGGDDADDAEDNSTDSDAVISTTTPAACGDVDHDPNMLAAPWPCGGNISVRMEVIYPATVPSDFAYNWLTQLNDASDELLSMGSMRGWIFETAMQGPSVRLLPSGALRAGAYGAVLSIYFVPANPAQKVVITASKPDGWSFDRASVCDVADEDNVVCINGLGSTASPQVLQIDNLEIKAQVAFAREIRDVKLADGGGLATFELATFIRGQTGEQVAVDSSGEMVSFLVPGVVEVTDINVRVYRGFITDPGDKIFALLPPRLAVKESVLTFFIQFSQEVRANDAIVFDDPSGSFLFSKDDLLMQQVQGSSLQNVPIRPSLKGQTGMKLIVQASNAVTVAPNVRHYVRMIATLRDWLKLPPADAVHTQWFNVYVERESEPLPTCVNDALLEAKYLTEDKWAAAYKTYPFFLKQQSGAPLAQIQVMGTIPTPEQATGGDVILIAPIGVTLLSPCMPTPCKEVVQDWSGTGRPAAVGLNSSTGSLALRVELPRDWESENRKDWLVMVGGADPYNSYQVAAWNNEPSVSLRQMPADVSYAAVAKTLNVQLTVKLTPGEAAIALIPGGARCYVKVRAPNGYVLKCGTLFQSISPTAPAEAICEEGETTNEAIVALDNAILENVGTLMFTFGMDTPAINPSNNIFVMSLLDAGNISVDANVQVPAMKIPQQRIQSSIAYGITGIESLDWLQQWAVAARDSGALASSMAETLQVPTASVEIDGVEAKLGVPSSRRLQAGSLSGTLQVDFSIYESEEADSPSLAEIETAMSQASFTTELVQNLGDAVSEAGLSSVTLASEAYKLSDGKVLQPPNCTTPTLRWSTSAAQTEGKVRVDLIFQSSTTLLKAVLVKMPEGYEHLMRSADDMSVIQRGAASPFPVLDNGEDGSFLETWSPQTIRVLLKDDANVLAGGYAFEIPFKMPARNPKENFWEVSLCMDVHCDGPRHESVITSFSILGFAIGDTPNLLTSETVYDASCSFRRPMLFGLLVAVSSHWR